MCLYNTVLACGGIALCKKESSQFDVVALLHGILFAYQKTLKDIYGEAPSSLVLMQTIPIIKEILQKVSPNLLNIGDVDKALKSSLSLLIKEQKTNRIFILE